MSEAPATKTVEYVIAAAPGFRVHHLLSEEPRIAGPGEAVVAWIVEIEKRMDDGERVNTRADPVTAGGEQLQNAYVIEQPDGTVIFPENMVVPSLEDAKAYLEDGEAYMKRPAGPTSSAAYPTPTR